MVERSIAWLVRGTRRVRYRGVAKNDHRLHRRAAALNLRRLITLGLGPRRHRLGARLSPPSRPNPLPTTIPETRLDPDAPGEPVVQPRL